MGIDSIFRRLDLDEGFATQDRLPRIFRERGIGSRMLAEQEAGAFARNNLTHPGATFTEIDFHD